MACELKKDCKRPEDIKRRGFDLSWFSAAKWQPGIVIALNDRRRPILVELGGQQGVTGYEYIATIAGQTGETEPEWPTAVAGTVEDGSVTWTRAAISAGSLEKTITAAGDVTWIVESPMSVANPTLVNSGGVVAIAADHIGGVAGTKKTVTARVTFSDGTQEDFGIRWTISR